MTKRKVQLHTFELKITERDSKKVVFEETVYFVTAVKYQITESRLQQIVHDEARSLLRIKKNHHFLATKLPPNTNLDVGLISTKEFNNVEDAFHSFEKDKLKVGPLFGNVLYRKDT